MYISEQRGLKLQNSTKKRFSIISISMVMLVFGFVLGSIYARSVIREQNFEYFLSGVNNHSEDSILDVLYNLYRSIDGLEFTDEYAIERIGDIYYCRSSYQAALLNYELARKVMHEAGYDASVDSYTNEKIMAIQDRDYSASVLAENADCD